MREDEWISVKDRLPEEGQEVLVWSDRYGRTIATYMNSNRYGTIWKYSSDPLVTFNAPSKWQPLPPAPKEK